jgi:isoleucyl-tRNA synthetase
VRAAQRELPLKLRNVYAFFTIYAGIDGFDPSDETCRAGRRAAAQRARVDRWILSELGLATRAVIEHMDAYRVYDATGVLTEFVDAVSNWYVRRNRDRFWAPGLDQDKFDVHWTLYECLVELAKLLAPFLPYAAEDMWQNLVQRPFPDSSQESVHLADYPEGDGAAVDAELSRMMSTVRELVSLGLQVRTANKLRVRQPLSAAEIVLGDRELEAALREHADLIRDELNIHELHFVERADDYVTYKITPNFRALGPRVGRHMPQLKAALAEADGAALLRELATEGRVRVAADGDEIELGPDEIAVSLEAREGFAAAAGGAGVVVLCTTLTPELVNEGLFREVLNRVQTFRKELDLEYTGRIRLTLAGSSKLIDAVRPYAEELGRETLAVEVSLDTPASEEAHVSQVIIDGESLILGFTLV